MPNTNGQTDFQTQMVNVGIMIAAAAASAVVTNEETLDGFDHASARANLAVNAASAAIGTPGSQWHDALEGIALALITALDERYVTK